MSTPAPLTDNVDYLPLWKAGATAEERLLELAMMARKHPERFAQFVVVYVENCDEKSTRMRYVGLNTTTTELMGLLAMAQFKVYNYVTGKEDG